MNRKIISCILFFLTFTMMLFIVFTKIIGYIENKNSETVARWEAEIDFPIEDTHIELSQKSKSNIYEYENTVNGITDKIENIFTTEFKYRYFFVILKNQFLKLLGQDMTVALANGQDDQDLVVHYQNSEDSLSMPMHDVNIDRKVEAVIEFGKGIEEKGINFFFFEVPDKCSGEGMYLDYSQEKNVQFHEAMEEAELRVLTVKDYFNKPSESYFYKTDHHWLPETGIWADKILCNYMNSEFGYSVNTEIYECGKYRTEVFNEPFLGSLGKKVTHVYTNADEFKIIYPQYQTDLTVFVSNQNKIFSGSIEETLFDYSALESKGLYEDNFYAFYGYGDNAWINIHNNMLHDGSRVLLLKQSYANCMYPFLGFSFEDMDVIDLRHFNGSLEKFILDRKPQTVIICYGIDSFSEKGNENSLFDFR